MLEFLPAEKLKKKFEVFGHFYSIHIAQGEQIDCRSVLEIVATKDKPYDINLLLERAADAIFIMMNPGSSIPLDEVNNHFSHKQVGNMGASLVRTRPDTTQYQVMRIMHYCNWSHVRVLNLSDLRNPKGGDFAVQFRDIEQRTGFRAHSIFSDERTCERNLYLTRKPLSPIVCAWGVSPALDPLVERCLSKLTGIPERMGLLKPGTDNRYFHPLPTLQTAKIQWVDKMVRQINS